MSRAAWSTCLVVGCSNELGVGRHRLADGGLEIVSSFNRGRTSSRSDRDSPFLGIEQSVLSILSSNHAQERIHGAAIAGKFLGIRGGTIMIAQRPVVLVVEDNKDLRDLLALMLLESGCRILEAEDGKQAVQLARKSHPDLVLMDLNLPQLNGI